MEGLWVHKLGHTPNAPQCRWVASSVRGSRSHAHVLVQWRMHVADVRSQAIRSQCLTTGTTGWCNETHTSATSNKTKNMKAIITFQNQSTKRQQQTCLPNPTQKMKRLISHNISNRNAKQAEWIKRWWGPDEQRLAKRPQTYPWR